MTPFSSRAATRRELALFADLADPAARRSLAVPAFELLLGGPLAREDAVAALVAYLFDAKGGALLALDDARAAWLDTPAFTWIGPGNAAPLDDHLAAFVAAPALVVDGTLGARARAARFAPRADDVIALAVGSLDPAVQAATLAELFAERGPDPEILALSTVQCGRALAWSSHLLAHPIAEQIVDALLARLTITHASTHLDQVMRVLGPIARDPGPLGGKVRAAALAGLDARRAGPRSFLEQVTSISASRGDLERYKELPRVELARAHAFILGYAAPRDRDEFAALRRTVLDHPAQAELFVPFVDGLVATGHVPAVAELVATLLDAEEQELESALALAAALPLDPLAHELVGYLDASSAGTRLQAIAAVELLADDANLRIDDRLAARLSDPSPEVCAAATRTLLERGRRDLVARQTAREPHRIRRAILFAGLGELAVPAIADLVAGALGGLDEIDPSNPAEGADDTPITRLIADCLLSTYAGLELAIDLVRDLPDAAGLLALAAVPRADRDVGVLVDPDPRARLARVTIDVAMHETDTELGTLALFLLCRMSAGDETIAELVADALTGSDGFGAQMVAALGELRVATAKTGAALAPFLAADAPIGERVAAAAIAGRALPAEHAAWSDVRALLELGTFARAAAWAALRDRARRQLAP